MSIRGHRSFLILPTYWTAIIRPYWVPPCFRDLVTCCSRATVLGKKFVSSPESTLGPWLPFTSFFQEKLRWECISTEAPMARQSVWAHTSSYIHNYHLVQKFMPDKEKRQKRNSSKATIFLLSTGLQVRHLWLHVLGKKSKQSVNTRRDFDSTPLAWLLHCTEIWHTALMTLPKWIQTNSWVNCVAPSPTRKAVHVMRMSDRIQAPVSDAVTLSQNCTTALSIRV